MNDWRNTPGFILRPIPGFSGYYADQTGQVWSLKPRRPHAIPELRRLECFPSKNGYLRTSVLVGKKRFNLAVHRAVCLAFHGLPGRGQQVRHIDGTRLNNRPENLKWGTAKENQGDRVTHGTTCRGERGGNAKLTDLDVVRIRRIYGSGLRQVDIAVMFGVSRTTIGSIVRGDTWGHIGGSDK